MSWLQSNFSNVLSGIIASVIVLAMQIFTRAASSALAEALVMKARPRSFIRLRTEATTFVVSGAISGVSEDARAAILAGPDAEAASSVIATLGLLYPGVECRHVYSSSFPADMYKENIIVVGGPINNRCAKIMMRNAKLRVHFTNEFALAVDGVTFRPEYDDKDHPIIDYGVVLRLANPMDTAKDAILLMGCDTFGVLAAAQLICVKRDGQTAQRQLAKTLGLRRIFQAQSYLAIVRCRVLGETIGQLELVHARRIGAIR